MPTSIDFLRCWNHSDIGLKAKDFESNSLKRTESHHIFPRRHKEVLSCQSKVHKAQVWGIISMLITYCGLLRLQCTDDALSCLYNYFKDPTPTAYLWRVPKLKGQKSLAMLMVLSHNLQYGYNKNHNMNKKEFKI